MTDVTLITGANRGIGLELVRQYREAGWRVFAGCRSPETAIQLNRMAAASEGQVTVHPLDVTNPLHIQAMVAVVGDTPIDLLVNNAGVAGQRDVLFGNTDESAWLTAFQVNTIAPMKVMEAFADAVARSTLKIMATISSRLGSIAENDTGGNYAYRASKAAVNAVMKGVAVDLKPRGIIVVAVHPGWVKTDMGGRNAAIEVAASVTSLRRLLGQVTQCDSGKFFDTDGTIIPW